VTDFLTNLALRAAGVTAVARPERSAPPSSETPELRLGLKESAQEEVTPRAVPTPSREDGRRPDTRPPAAPERADLAPQVAVPERPENGQAPLRPVPAALERIREVQTEHHEIVREAAPAPPIEVHETIREKEIVRETLVERELHVEAPPPPPRVLDRPAAVPGTTRGLEVEPVSEEVVRDVVKNTPVAARPPTLSPAPRAHIAPAPTRTERVSELAPEPPSGRDREMLPHERSDTVPPARVTAPPKPLTATPPSTAPVTALPALVTANPASHEFQVPVKTAPLQPRLAKIEPPVVTAKEPVLRPAPLPDAPGTFSAERLTAPRQKAVEVTIGSIEIRTAVPSPQPKTPEPARPHEPIEGFDGYKSVRRYSAWFRE